MADISNLEGIDEFKKYFLEVMKKQLLDTFVDKTSREGNVNKTQAIRNIKSAFSNDKLVLVLGAGISMQFGIPDWETLLQKLMVKTIDEKLSHPDIIANLFNYTFSPSPLIAARYLQKHFESERLSFEKEVKNVLYSKYKQDTSSELVNEIVNLCVAPGKSPNLNSIITYNYDDIIEQKISELNLPIPYKSIYGTGMLPENDELPIFHVHGFLPRKGGVGRNNMITLGESMYHEQYNDIYSWNNIVQINKFRDFTCLFLGSSLKDPNTRRLLDIANKQKGKSIKYHYIVKIKPDKAELKNRLREVAKEKKIITDENKEEIKFVDTLNNLEKIYINFEENDGLSFGVRTIWIDNYHEIPELLKDLRT